MHGSRGHWVVYAYHQYKDSSQTLSLVALSLKHGNQQEHNDDYSDSID